MFKNIKKINISPLELILGGIVILFVGYLHASNMFNFPLYENDEGIYMSQAWAVSKLNQLSPYVYWYDHTPFGWMVLSFFVTLLGGFNTFGNAINTGRVVMFIFQIVVCICILSYSKILTKKIYAGLGSVLLFGTIPNAVFFHRRVLLDNIMVFFLALSLIPLIKEKVSNKSLIISGLIFAFMVLSKETGIIFLPVFLIFLWFKLEINRRVLGLILFICSSFSMILMYPVMALLKTELFPSNDKTSLIGTLMYQGSRGSGLPFWDKNSDIQLALTNLFSSSAISMQLAFAYLISTTLGLIILYRKKYFFNKEMLFLQGLLFSYLLFSIRGKLFIDFYIIPFYFLISVSSIYVFSLVFDSFNAKSKYILAPLTTVLAIMFGLYSIQINSKTLNYDEVSPSQKVLNWINSNVETNKAISMDYGILMDLKDGKNSKVYPNADNFWKVDFEKEIKRDKLKDNPFNLDYIYVSNQLYSDMSAGSVPFNKKAYVNSKNIVNFNKDNIKAEINKVVKDRNFIVRKTWDSMKISNALPSIENNIIKLNLSSKLNDRSEFLIVQEQLNQQLFVNQEYKKLSNSNLLQIIEAGLMNYQNWGEFNPIYKQASDFILENKLKTVKDNSKNVTYQYLQENQFSNNNGGVISKLDFGYFKPHIFSKLNEIYQDARYNTLKEDGYKLLNVLTNLNPKIQNVYLLENPENGINILSEIESKQYNIDILNNDEANLVYYYINKDYQITKNKAVETFAKKQSEFYTQQYEQRGFVPSSIDMKGNVKTNSQNLMNNTGMYALFKMANYKNADKLWHSEFINNIEYDPSLKDFTTFGKNLPINEIYWGSMTLADEPN